MLINEEIIQLITAKGSLTPAQIISETGKPRSSVFKALTELLKEGRLVKQGQHPQIAYSINTEPVQTVQDSPKTVQSIVPIPSIQSKTEYRSGLSYLIIILSFFVIILIAFLVYYIFKYRSSELRITDLSIEMNRQDQRLGSMDQDLLVFKAELERKNEEVMILSQKKDQQGLLLVQQKEALSLQQGRLDSLNDELKNLVSKMEKDRKELLEKIASKDSVNAKLKEDLLRIEKSLNDLEFSYKNDLAVRAEKEKASQTPPG